LLKNVILHFFTKRKIAKAHVLYTDLNDVEQNVYRAIHSSWSDAKRRKHIFDNIQIYSKRSINYFVINFTLTVEPVSYYIRKDIYPYPVVGELNKPNQTCVSNLVYQGVPIMYVDLHNEYKKNKTRFRNYHVPYGRSPIVSDLQHKGEPVMTLSEINYFIWFDSIGGFSILRRMSDNVCKHKSKFDRHSRQIKRRRTNNPSIKKSKITYKTATQRSETNYCTEHFLDVLFSIE
jgi:hypothetical protein